MNARYQTTQSSVTSFAPFCNRSCKFVHWPENIRSSNTCQVQAFQNNFRWYVWQFSYRFHFFFEMMVINAWSGYFVELLSRLVRQLTKSFHTFLGMTLHIIRPRRNTTILRVCKFFSSPPRKFAIQTWLCNCPQYLCLFHIVFECSPSIHDQEKMLVLPNRLLWVLSTSDQCFVSFQPIWCHPDTQIRTTFFYGVRISIPNWKPSPNRTSKGFSQIAFPITVLPKDDRTDSSQEERLGLPCWTMILAICVMW